MMNNTIKYLVYLCCLTIIPFFIIAMFKKIIKLEEMNIFQQIIYSYLTLILIYEITLFIFKKINFIE